MHAGELEQLLFGDSVCREDLGTPRRERVRIIVRGSPQLGNRIDVYVATNGGARVGVLCAGSGDCECECQPEH
ncbi:MAG: hypothetical protein ACRELD_04545 [Longimicrobiales bacterium]